MGRQMTEMLKGTLEGIVLALLVGAPAYGYEITAQLRERGYRFETVSGLADAAPTGRMLWAEKRRPA